MVVQLRLVVALIVSCALTALAPPPAAGQASVSSSGKNLAAAVSSSRTNDADTSGRFDTGIAGGKNFTVVAPRGDHLAEKVVARAEELRKEIALAWLGEELADGKGRTHITLELAKDKDQGLTWLCGPGRQVRGDHRMFLTTSAERATGSTLAHEVTHVVLAVRFPQGMPAWANEGIASLADDDERHETRRRLSGEWARESRWPSLEQVLYQRTIQPSDQAAYTAAASLVEFLLEKGDRRALVGFVGQAQQDGWDSALRTSYGIPRVADLQRQWQEWVTRGAR